MFLSFSLFVFPLLFSPSVDKAVLEGVSQINGNIEQLWLRLK